MATTRPSPKIARLEPEHHAALEAIKGRHGNTIRFLVSRALERLIAEEASTGRVPAPPELPSPLPR